MVTCTPPPGKSAVAVVLLVASALWWPGSAAVAAPAPPGRPSLEVTGATRIEYDDASHEWMFRGPRVVVVRGTLRIEAPEVRYAEEIQEVTLPSGGTALTPTFEVTADRLQANLRTRHVTAEGHVAGRFSDESEPMMWGTFTAHRIEVDDRAERRQFVATGRVVIVRGDRHLSGDRVVYDHQVQQGTVDGQAELARGSDRLRADHVFADLRRHEARADDHVLLDQDGIHGSADHATYNEPDQTAVLLGNVKILRGRDTLAADRATVLLGRHTAIAEGHVEVVAYPEGAAP
ncbi:MAG TPA: LptA/OstA family protein [bacterium]|nr:LptA/OstA family protein [bacterium]